MKPYVLPISFFLILLIGLRFSIIQVVPMYLNLGFCFLLGEITALNTIELVIPLNFIFALPMIILYYKANKNYQKFITAILFTFFTYGFFAFLFEDYLINTELYFLQFFVEPFVIGIALLVSDYLKLNKFSKSKL